MRILEADPVDTIVQREREAMRLDAGERLGQISWPTLIVTGEFETPVSRHSNAAASRTVPSSAQSGA